MMFIKSLIKCKCDIEIKCVWENTILLELIKNKWISLEILHSTMHFVKIKKNGTNIKAYEIELVYENEMVDE